MKVNDAISEKNKEITRLTNIQIKKLELEVLETQNENYEKLEDNLFGLEEKLLLLENDINKHNYRDKEQLDERRLKLHLKKKIARLQNQKQNLKKELHIPDSE